MINLVKGQTIDLRKNENGQGDNNLSKITIWLGWDEKKSGGLFGFGGSSESFDLDAVALLLGPNSKLMSNDDIVYYGQKMHKSNKIWLTGDNLTGTDEAISDDKIKIIKKVNMEETKNNIWKGYNFISGVNCDNKSAYFYLYEQQGILELLTDSKLKLEIFSTKTKIIHIY